MDIRQQILKVCCGTREMTSFMLQLYLPLGHVCSDLPICGSTQSTAWLSPHSNISVGGRLSLFSQALLYKHFFCSILGKGWITAGSPDKKANGTQKATEAKNSDRPRRLTLATTNTKDGAPSWPESDMHVMKCVQFVNIQVSPEHEHADLIKDLGFRKSPTPCGLLTLIIISSVLKAQESGGLGRGFQRNISWDCCPLCPPSGFHQELLGWTVRIFSKDATVCLFFLLPPLQFWLSSFSYSALHFYEPQRALVLHQR